MIDIRATRTRLVSPLVASLLTVLAGYRVPAVVPDSEFYIALALGNQAQVPAPFSQRLAHPLLARLLVESGAPTPFAFAAIAVACVVVYFLALRSLLRDLPDIQYLLLAVTPLAVLMFREAFLPDLFSATALALFLAVLRRSSSSWWVGALILPLFLIRESALLVGLVVVVVCWRHGRRRTALTAVLATAAGYLVSGALGAAGAASRHDVAGPLYLAAKIPYNGLKNLTGFSVFTDDTPVCTPLVSGPLPAPVGAITEVGICPFDPIFPLATLLAWVTLFGVLPAVLIAARRCRATRSLTDVWVRVALWTGLIAFVAAPLLGASVRRLASYGWPAFLVAVPVVLALLVPAGRRLWIIAVSFAVSWLPVVLDTVLDGTAGLVVAIVLAVSAHVVAYRMALDAFGGLAVSRSAEDPIPAPGRPDPT